MRVERAAPQAPAGAPSAATRRTTLLAVAGALALLVGVVTTVYQRAFPEGLRVAAHDAAVERGYGAHGNRPGGFAALGNASRRVANNLLDPPDLPTLVIDIKFRHLQQLYARREAALQQGFLIQEEGDVVPASIRLGERSIPVRLRLKGDMLDHLRTDKWSLRIYTRGGEELFGLRRFSVQSPSTRGFQAELLFLETLRRFGVLAPRYFFVNVVVDGNSVGVMAVEEHFAKELLERNGRKDGVILRFDESLLWQSRLAKGERNQRFGGPFESHVTAPIDAFQLSRILESKSLSRQLEIGGGLLRAYVDGQLPASEVFDGELLGRYLAVAEAWDAWHAVVWPNMRFYLNPLTMRLEPIGFDADISEAFGVGSTIFAEGILAEKMLRDPVVKAAFDRTLQAIRNSVEDGSLIDDLRRVEQPALRALHTEYFFLEGMDFDLFARRVRSLPVAPSRSPEATPYPVYVLAELVQDGPHRYLELANPLPETVTVGALEWMDATGGSIPFEAEHAFDLPLVLPPTPVESRPATLRLGYRTAPAIEQSRLRVTATGTSSVETRVTYARKGYAPLHARPLPVSSTTSALARHPFLSFADAGKVATIRQGTWVVEGSLVIPDGYALRVEAGTTLRFQPSAALIAYGETDFRGTALAPIVLEPSSAKDGWQGVVVHQAARRSEWSYVVVRGTTGVSQGAWDFTGGITFYRSDIAMSDCTLVGNKAEDALNIVHSDFSLDGLTVRDTASDGVDSDFSTGRISGADFRDIGIGSGADAVDVSGSTVAVEDSEFSRITDKALSVGEGSTLTAARIYVENCGAGAVSKDGSSLRLSNAEIHGARIAGLMTYTKKPEYGPSRLVAEAVKFVDTDQPALAQGGTSLTMNGTDVAAGELDVDGLYSTVMKPARRQ